MAFKRADTLSLTPLDLHVFLLVDYPLPESVFPICIPVLLLTISWSSFLVPTHSGSELRSFRNAAAIAALQDEAQLTLNSYIHTR